MPNAAQLQTSFLGGEFSPFFQGRADDPRYKTGMNVCRNTIPVEQGTASRRPGTALAAATRNGAPAKLLNFDFTSSIPYSIEFTDGFIRFFAGMTLVQDAAPPPVLSISASNPAVVETVYAHGWSTGDQVVFGLGVGQASFLGFVPLVNRQFRITVIDAFHFSLTDAITGATVDGSTINIVGQAVIVARITTFTTPWTAQQWKNARIVQNSRTAFILVPGFPPYALTSSFLSTAIFAQFAFGVADLEDGPYLDPATDGTTVTPSGYTGTITCTFSAITSINDGKGFQSSDVGRSLRLFSEPSIWNSATAYPGGSAVKFDGAYYLALKANTNVPPNSDLTTWAVGTGLAAWTWGIIQSVVSTSQVTVAIEPASLDLTGTPRADGPLGYLVPIVLWRLGAYSGYTGYPTCGTYYEGRFYLGGAIANRFDATKSNELFRFDPTGWDGTVADNNGIDETLNSDELEQALWFLPTAVGVVIGTQPGEWLIQASSIGDPVTPTSIQAHRVTKYGSANVQALQTGLSVVFVQRYGRKMIEYIADVYSGKFSGTNIAITGQHLLNSGIVEIAYQREKTPIVWARMANGTLAGCTYKRESPFGTQPASFSAWHRHDLGTGRVVESLQTGPSIGGNLDSVMLVTNDPNTNIRWVEMLTDMFEENEAYTQAWFVDAGIVPAYSRVTSDGLGVKIYGYWPHVGKTLAVFFGGLDMGNLVVQADSSIYVPFGSDPDKLFTQAYLDSLNAAGVSYAPLSSGVEHISTTGGVVPGTPTTVQSYIWNGASVNYDALVDYANLQFIGMNHSSHKWDVFSLGGNTQIQEFDPTTLPGNDAYPGEAFLGNGHIYYCASSATNTEVLYCVNSLTFSPVGSFGTAGSSLTPGQNGIMLPIGGSVYAGLGGEFFAYTTVNGSIDFVFNALPWTPQYLYSAYLTSAIPSPPTYSSLKGAAICKGPQNSAYSVLYWASQHQSLQGGGDQLYVGRVVTWNTAQAFAASRYWDFGIAFVAGNIVQFKGIAYQALSNNTNVQPDMNPAVWAVIAPQGIRLEVIRTVFPADIDVTWTNFNIANAIAIYEDPQDGNLITSYFTTDAVTNKAYMVKINATNGTIMWKTPFPQLTAFPRPDSRVVTGRLNFVANAGGNMVAYCLNTLDGTYTQSVTMTAIIGGTGFSDDVTGYLIMNGNYTAGGSNVAQAGNTPANFANTWYRLAMGIGPTSTATVDSAPCVAGYPFISQGQILRSIAPQEAGSQSGPALAMTRRTHMFGALLHQTQGISFGTTFSNLHAAAFKSKGGTPYLKSQLFSSVYWDTIESDYSFDDMLCWQITRPYPANVVAINAFHQTQDR